MPTIEGLQNFGYWQIISKFLDYKVSHNRIDALGCHKNLLHQLSFKQLHELTALVYPFINDNSILRR